jgi:uncharacterized membrane protein
VLFIMISNHYPMTYGSEWGWLVLAALSAAGVLVRRFFVLSHKGRLHWTLPAAAALIVVAAAISIAPRQQPVAATTTAAAAVPGYASVANIVAQRCAVCHAANPTEPGFSAPPNGVLLDTPTNVKLNAQRIYVQAVASHAMPLGNLTHMTDAERATLGAWIDAGANL